MLARKLLPRKHALANREPNTKRIGLFVVLILVAAIAIQAVNWFTDDQRLLLTIAPGLVLIESSDDPRLDVPRPTDTLGSTVHEIGYYTRSTTAFPDETLAIVYVRNNWRFVEIDYLPGRSLEEQTALTNIYGSQEVLIDGHTALLVEIDERPRCIDYEDDLPNRCEISRQLFFEVDEYLVLISADGEHATDGELLLLAQDILGAKNIDNTASPN